MKLIKKLVGAGKRHYTEQQKLASYLKTQERIDLKILLTVFLLCAYGVIMVYSASSYRSSISARYSYNPFFFAQSQIFALGLGTFAMLVVTHLNYRKFMPLSLLAYGGGIISILLLKSPLGVSAGGAVRWLDLGISIQVAEVVKITVILFLAGFAHHNVSRIDKIPFLFIMWGFGGVAALLIVVISNDLSSGVIIAGITFGITFIVSKWRSIHFFLIFLAGAGTTFLYTSLKANMPSVETISETSFRLGRIAAWIDPERYADSLGYQPLQGLYAIASGGLTGKGLGNGIQKLTKIPESQNDMIFSVICEELGLLGAAVLIILIGYLLFQMFRISLSCTHLFGSMLVAGVLIHIFLQTFVNIAVVTGLFPNTGASLPFISYGGSALLFTLCEVGLVLSVYRQSKKEEMERKEKQAAASPARPGSYRDRLNH